MNKADFDVLIVGAGISGISMAVHLKRECPDHSFAMLEARADLGGTWDLFRYPGVRSDSDMYTLGFDFEPWRQDESIARGETILAYLNRVVDDYGVRPHIRLNHRVIRAAWSSADALWALMVDDGTGQHKRITARYLSMGSGYYDYAAGHNPDFAGREDFGGAIVHPQFWPQDLDYTGKRVVVIGSGATAVTLVPSMAHSAAHVTMLQRTPTYHIVAPSRDRLANLFRKIMPARWAYALTRFKNVQLQSLLYRRAKAKPAAVADYLITGVDKALGGRMNAADWTPPYGPWDQRLCLVPDNDLFDAISAGRASVVTDTIERFDESGICLSSGRHLDADIIVTATGLKVLLAGKVDFTIDGEPVHWPDHYFYKGAMVSNVPNLTMVFGYLNASWTLKADIVARYTCRVLNHMRGGGYDIATPVLRPEDAEADAVLFDFSSGYLQRATALMPRNGVRDPWRMSQDFAADRLTLINMPVQDGILRFSRASGDSERAAGQPSMQTET